jgi:hypothetical protein
MTHIVREWYINPTNRYKFFVWLLVTNRSDNDLGTQRLVYCVVHDCDLNSRIYRQIHSSESNTSSIIPNMEAAPMKYWYLCSYLELKSQKAGFSGVQLSKDYYWRVIFKWRQTERLWYFLSTLYTRSAPWVQLRNLPVCKYDIRTFSKLALAGYKTGLAKTMSGIVAYTDTEYFGN